MPQLIVHEWARRDVDDIARWIAADRLAAALKFADDAERAFEFLAENPLAGPRLDPPLPSMPDLRSWPFTRSRNYLVLYVPLADGARVIRVVDGRRAWRGPLTRE